MDYIINEFISCEPQGRENGRVSQWKVCYQQGLPCLVVEHSRLHRICYLTYFQIQISTWCVCVIKYHCTVLELLIYQVHL